MKNKRYLFLLVLILVIFSSISVFANDWVEMELITEEDGQPVATHFRRGVTLPWRYSSSQGGVGNQGNQGVWTVGNKSFSDKTMMQMMRGEIPNDRITFNPKPTIELPQAIKNYLANGGSVDNIKIKFLPKDLGEEQDFRNGWGALVPTGPIFDLDYFYVELPKYKINPQNGTVEIEYKYAFKYNQLDGFFYTKDDDPNMKATVMKMDSIYGYNSFAMWTQGGTHIGATSSQGTANVRQLPPSQTLTKDKIVDSTGRLIDGLVLHNTEGFIDGFEDTITTPGARIGYGTFSVGGSIGYALNVPLYLEFYLAETNNIRIGSEQYKIGDNYNARVVDVATNKVLDPETDKLFIGKKYRMDYFAGYESTKGDKLKTNNAPIVTNFYMYYNGRDSSNPSDLHIPNIRDLDNLPFLEKANKENETLSSKKWDESKIDVSKIAKYQQEFEIEKIDKHGKKVEKVRVCAYLPYQHSFYTEYNGDKSLGDNDVRNDDHVCLEFEVDTSEANTLLAHAPNNSIVRAGNREFDRLEVRKYSESGRLINSVINTDSCDPLGEGNVCGEVLQGETLKLTAYVKREDIPINPAGEKNPIYVRDIKLYLNETINEQIKPIDQKENNTIYKTGIRRPMPELVKISMLNEDGTQGPFVDYDPSIHGGEKFEAGTVLVFEMNYTVPTQSELFDEKSTKYNGYYSPVSKSLVRLALSMNLAIDASNKNASLVNYTLSDDWTKTILTVSKDKRNMQVWDVLIKDENGEIVGTSTSCNTVNPKPLVLRSDMNYEITPQILYEYIEGEPSINQNLQAEVYVIYDGIPPEHYSILGKDLVESEKKGYWYHGDIGTYTISQQKNVVNVKQYYPNASDYPSVANAIKAKPDDVSVSPYNPLVLPIKHLKVSRGTIVVKIPDMYKTRGNDDELGAGCQVKHIDFIVEGAIDNSITIKGLYSTSDEDFGRSEDNCLPIDPTMYYYALIEVKRETGTGDKLENPKIEVYVNYDGDVNRLMPAQIIEGSVIENPGDTVLYKVGVIPGTYGSIHIKANLPHMDINMSNNSDFSCWEGRFDISITNFKVEPDSITLARLVNGRFKEVEKTIKFSAIIGFSDFLDNRYKEFSYYDLKVPVEIREFKNGRPTGNIYFSTMLHGYNEVHLPISGHTKEPIEIEISNTFKDPVKFSEVGQYAYEISVNGGTGTDTRGDYNYRKYKEYSPVGNNPYENNVSRAYITAEPADGCVEQDCPPCDTGGGTHRGPITWSQDFFSVNFYTTPDIIDVDIFDNQGNFLRTEKRYICRAPVRQEVMPWGQGGAIDIISFFESYGINIYFQSQETIDRGGGISIGGTPGWINITGRKAYVRAGQWFDIRVVSSYTQNRSPCRGGAIPFCPVSPSYSVCHTRWSRPDTYSVQKESTMYIRTNAYNVRRDYEKSGPKSYYVIPNKRGSDISGETATRKYIPTHAIDGIYYINARNVPFPNYGVIGADDKHPAYGKGGIIERYEYIDGLRCDGGLKRCLVICEPRNQIAYFWDNVSAEVIIENQLPIKTQIIGN